MKRLTTIVCCLAFMICGISLGLSRFKITNSQTAMASPPGYYTPGKLPLDLQLDLEKRHKTDTVYLPGDTVTVTKTVTNTKYVKVPQRKRTTDTLYKVMPIPGPIPALSVNNSIAGDREEYTPVGLQSSKRRSISLTVDGRVVYSTENDIHSTEDRQ